MVGQVFNVNPKDDIQKLLGKMAEQERVLQEQLLMTRGAIQALQHLLDSPSNLGDDSERENA